MDLTRRATLNYFGLVQHAVYESADHNAVHVIYRHTQKGFVHTELTKELETRTGLQLVPPQSRVSTSSSKGDGVIIVILDSPDSLTNRLLYRHVSLTDRLLYRHVSLIDMLLYRHVSLIDMLLYSHDSLTNRLLCEAVETAEHPDTHTLFLQKGKYHPDWVGNKLPRSALMLYPQSGVERSQFWTTLTTMIGEWFRVQI